MHKLVLGTAQLGIEDYGICNLTGMPTMEEAGAIVNEAHSAGIVIFDTSPLYGRSEDRLGAFLKGKRAKIYTKVDFDEPFMETPERQFTSSLIRLQRDSVEGVFINENTVPILPEVMASKWKEDGRIKKFGISVYNMERAYKFLHSRDIDMVQIPFNLLDQRALKADIFKVARDLGKEVFVRSVFLQGDLLNYDNACYNHVSSFQLRKLTQDFKWTPMEFSFKFIKENAPDANILVGVENLYQLRGIIRAYTKVSARVDFSACSISDPKKVYKGMVDPKRFE